MRTAPVTLGYLKPGAEADLVVALEAAIRVAETPTRSLQSLGRWQVRFKGEALFLMGGGKRSTAGPASVRPT